MIVWLSHIQIIELGIPNTSLRCTGMHRHTYDMYWSVDRRCYKRYVRKQLAAQKARRAQGKGAQT